MKQTLIALALLFALPAQAQTLYFQPVTGSQSLDYGATSLTVTQATQTYTEYVRLVCTTACYVAWSSTSTNLTADVEYGHFLPANEPAVFRIGPGARYIAAIQLSSSGILSVMELSP